MIPVPRPGCGRGTRGLRLDHSLRLDTNVNSSQDHSRMNRRRCRHSHSALKSVLAAPILATHTSALLRDGRELGNSSTTRLFPRRFRQKAILTAEVKLNCTWRCKKYHGRVSGVPGSLLQVFQQTASSTDALVTAKAGEFHAGGAV